MRHRKRRIPTRFPAMLAIGQDIIPGVIHDISEDGMKFRADEGLTTQAVGCRIRVHTDTLGGAIRWRVEQTIGIRLARPLDPRLFAVIIHQPWIAGARAPGAWRPGRQL